MARLQSRRTVSLSSSVYTAARRLAASQGLTLSHLTELALIMAGIEAKPGQHADPAVVAKAVRNRKRGRRVVSGLRVIRRVAQEGAGQ